MGPELEEDDGTLVEIDWPFCILDQLQALTINECDTLRLEQSCLPLLLFRWEELPNWTGREEVDGDGKGPVGRGAKVRERT